MAGLAGTTDSIGIGTDMSLGSYPPHEHDPWGEPDYPVPSEEYGRKVTPDVGSRLRYVEGFADYAEVVSLAERLLARGYREEDVRKILGENYLRLFERVWG